MDEVLLTIGSAAYLNSAGVFHFVSSTRADSFGGLSITSDHSAKMQIGIGMDFVWYAASQTLTVLFDQV